MNKSRSLLLVWILHLILIVVLELDAAAVLAVQVPVQCVTENPVEQILKFGLFKSEYEQHRSRKQRENKERYGRKALLLQLKHIGCYDFWTNRYPDEDITSSSFQEENDPDKCEEFCFPTGNVNSPESLLLVRGLFCGCLAFDTSGLVRVDPSLCDIPCGSSSSSDDRDDLRPCGGNYAVSIYCNPDRGDLCRDLPVVTNPGVKNFAAIAGITTPLSTSESNSDESTEILGPSKFRGQGHSDQTRTLCLPCFHCSLPGNCSPGAFHAALTYMPRSSPEVCIEFCGQDLEYYDARTQVMKIRSATKFTFVGWNNRAGTQVSICGCKDEPPPYEEVESEEYCTKPCSGDPDQICGGSPPFYFSLYLTTGDWEFCRAQEPSTTEISDESTDVSTTLSETTTLAISTTTTATESTAETEPTTMTTTVTTESTSTTTLTTTNVATTITVTVETPTFATTTEGSVELQPTELPCTLKCNEIDRHGKNWTACAGRLANQTCPRDATDTHGYALWNCSAEGTFVGLPDYSGCVTKWIRTIEIGEKEIIPEQTANDYLHLINTEVTNSTEDPQSPSPPNYFGHEIKEIIDILEKVLSQVNSSVSSPNFENMTEIAVNIDGNFLVNKFSWEELPIVNRSSIGTEVLLQIEANVFKLTSKLGAGAGTGPDKYRKYFPSQEGIKISSGAQSKSWTGNEGIQFPFADEVQDGSFIQLPDGWAQRVPGGSAAKLSFIGSAIASDLIKPILLLESSIGAEAGTTSDQNANFMNGKLMSFSLANPNPNGNIINFPDEGVKIKFRHDLDTSLTKMKDLPRRRHEGESPKPVFGSARCMFWDTSKLEWSSIGCKLVQTERSATMCECSHLTSFAVLMDVHNYLGKDFVLEILTLVICPLSIICLFVTILTFTFVRSTHGALTTITKNLCLSLLIGNALVLFIVDRHYLNLSEGVCMGSAIIVHYVFLTAFMWMGIQGYHLYKQMVYVFETASTHMTIYRVVAFGAPILIVGSTAVIAYLSDSVAYGGEMFCWLQGSYIWAFMAPVAAICVTNTIVLIITLRAAFQVRSRTNSIAHMRVKSSKISIKGGMSITVLLGLTWMTGFFLMADYLTSTIAAYVFTLLNASQGIFLFVFHCLLNEKVRVAAARKNIILPAWLSTSGGGGTSSPPESSQSQHKPKKNSTDTSSNGDTSPSHTPNPNPNCPRIKRRGSGSRQGVQSHLAIPNLETGFSSSNSSSSLKSSNGISGNESVGSQVDLLSSAERRFPRR